MSQATVRNRISKYFIFLSGRRIHAIQQLFKFAEGLSLQKAGAVSSFFFSRKELLRLINPGNLVKTSLFSLFSGATVLQILEAGMWKSWYTYFKNCLAGCVYLKVKSSPSQTMKLKLHLGIGKSTFIFCNTAFTEQQCCTVLRVIFNAVNVNILACLCFVLTH